MKVSLIKIMFLVVVVSFMMPTANAALNYFTNASGDKLWSNAGNWLDPYTNGDGAYLDLAYTTPKDPCAVIGSGVSANVGYLYVGDSDNGSFNLSLNGGNLNFTDVFDRFIGGRGINSAGTININSGSTLNMGNLGYVYLGHSATATGTINVNSGGTLTKNGNINLGHEGTGILNVNGGTATLNGPSTWVGATAGSQGTINVNSGTLTTNENIYLGYSGNGTLNVNGGTATLKGAPIAAVGTGSQGTIRVNSGTLNIETGYFYFGSVGTGLMEINGGTVNIAPSTLLLTGTYGRGKIDVKGGTLFNRGSLYIYDTLEVNGGTVRGNSFSPQTNSFYANVPQITVNSGLIDINDILFYPGNTAIGLPRATINGGKMLVRRRADLRGVLNVYGGEFEASDVYQGYYGTHPQDATINVYGGSLKANNFLYVGAYNPSVLNISGGNIAVGNGPGTSGLFLVSYTENGTMNMTGGVVDCNILGIGDWQYDGVLHLDGGVLNARYLSMGMQYDIYPSNINLDIKFGVLRLEGDAIANSNLSTYQSKGWITAFGDDQPKTGAKVIQTYYNAAANATYVYADPNFVVIDDFENYNGNIASTWTATTGAILSDTAVATHDGSARAMQFVYNLSGQTGKASRTNFYSDWSMTRYQKLRIFFRGTPGNAPVTLSAIIGDGTNTATVNYPGSASDLASSTWSQWDIDLDSLPVNLKNVTSVAIAATGTGAGTLYIDDVRLDGVRCVLPGFLTGDLNYDCKVNLKDCALFAQDWMTTNTYTDLAGLTANWLNSKYEP